MTENVTEMTEKVTRNLLCNEIAHKLTKSKREKTGPNAVSKAAKSNQKTVQRAAEKATKKQRRIVCWRW